MTSRSIVASARVGSSESKGIDWSHYSSSYDLMAKYNPHYQANIELSLELLSKLELPSDSVICDVGAGTGNYICALSELYRSGRFLHFDANPEMIEIAKTKYEKLGIDVAARTGEILDFPALKIRANLVVCINALYAISPQDDLLSWINSSLEPDGYFFVIDYGKKMNVAKWSKLIYASAYRNHGISGFLKLLFASVPLIYQNWRGSKLQEDGRYWLHSHEEFLDKLQESNFEVLEHGSCYNDECDYALCRKL